MGEYRETRRSFENLWSLVIGIENFHKLEDIIFPNAIAMHPNPKEKRRRHAYI